MNASADATLREETSSWCRQAEEAVGSPPDGWRAGAQLARQGILLRRRWDRIDPDAPPRRPVLRLLPAVQSIAHQRLTEAVHDPGEAEAERVDHVLRQLDEDDQYLVALLSDYAHHPESVAFAVECFRDDLHWLGTQVAALDGSGGVDFLGRVLLEEEAIEREMEGLESGVSSTTDQPRLPCANAPGAAPSREAVGSPTDRWGEGFFDAAEATRDSQVLSIRERLRSAARRLRATALAREVESLAEQPEPEDWEGWYRTWQAASRLAMRITPELLEASASHPEGAESGRPLSADTQRTVEAIRSRALDRWKQCLADLPPEPRDVVLRQVADELGDAANESLAFIEDLSLPDAVRSLEVLEGDVVACRQAVEEHGTAGRRRLRRGLRRQRAAVAGELQERRLAWRMERLFGPWFVAALERLILLLLLLFVGVLIIEGWFPQYEGLFAWIDLAICIVFLSEFSLKMGLAQRRWLYLRRNWLTGLLPSIPVAFLGYALDQVTLAQEGGLVVLLRCLRYLRLPRMARWLRIARPMLRVMRVVGFVLRASDRLVRQLAPLLNRNLVLFERAAVSATEPPYRARLSALCERFHYRAVQTIHWLPPATRCDLARERIEDLVAMLSSPRVGLTAPVAPPEASPAREIPAEGVIAWLLAATPAGISDRIGRTLAQSVTRWCRALDVLGIRRLPLVHDLVAASRLPNPYEATARVANRMGVMFGQLLDRVSWLADLYGTVTAPQLVDSVGEYVVKATARPARRLLTFGIGFLVVSYLAGLLDVAALNRLSAMLSRFIGWPLLVLGASCLALKLVGEWFRREAGEATEFYRQVAAAQFITATKKLKRRLAEPQYAVLHRRVIAPELTAAGQAESSGAAPDAAGNRAQPTDHLCAAVEQLWEDYLDGPPFHASDTATTNQVLGNLALISLRETRLQYDRRRTKRLRRLDLANTQLSIRGPYLWFRFISRSLAHHTAKLIDNYNAFVLPLSRAETAEDWEVQRYVGWLSKRLAQGVDQLDLPPPFRARCGSPGGDDGRLVPEPTRHARLYQGNDFTAIHFLSADAELEADVRRRYGDQLADLMCRDRRDNIRRVFRTYPFHRWPRERRTLNLLPLYQRHLAGGRVLLLPLKLLGWTVVLMVRGLRLLWRVVREVRNPSVRELAAVEDPDPFEVAKRKIYRMRRPLYLECLDMRAEFDPEYLGIVPPGASAGVQESSVVEIEEDLARIEAGPGVRRRFRQLAQNRRRQILDFRGWLERFGVDGLSGRSLRAMAIAYTVDHRAARSRLEAASLLEQAFDKAVAEQSLPRSARTMPGWSLASVWCGLRTWRRLRRLLRQPTFRRFDRRQRAVCRRWVRRRRGPLVAALKQLTPKANSEADAVEAAWQELLQVGRDPDTWTRQLVILRAVQTLSVLSLDTYCQLVYELGEYGTCAANHGGDKAPEP